MSKSNINDTLCQYLGMFLYFIVIRQHMNPVCEVLFEVGEGYRFATTSILSRSSHLRLFFFFVVVSGRDYKSRQSLGSAIVQCISGQPKSASREAFQKWIQRLKSWISNRRENFEGCNVYLIWMLFEISYNTHYKSNNPRIHKFILNDTLLIYITVAWIYSTWPKKN